MRTNWNKPSKRWKHQRGVTLIELMVVMVISLIVSTAMILLMASTLGTGTQTIQMTRLTQEMRTAMQLMSRDLRRANYTSSSEDCYGNVRCNEKFPHIGAITPVGGTCFQFWYDRTNDGVAPLDVGAFQLSSGVLQMLTTLDDFSDPCGSPSDGRWIDITDADIVSVTAFTASDESSYCADISPTDSLTINRIRLTMTGELQNTPQGIPISKTIEDIIYVRNPSFNIEKKCSEI
jgi:prepilin-type N-terminal cleavage/methylation domain-containing protein